MAHLVEAFAGGWSAFNQAVRAPARLASITLLDPAQVVARFSPAFVLGAITTAPGVPHPLTDRFLAWLSD